MLAKAANNRVNEYCRESFDPLKDLSCEARINKFLPKQVTEREDDIVLNSAFLVGKDEVGDFINIVDVLILQRYLRCKNWLYVSKNHIPSCVYRL